jgi:DNA-binding NarL/FixJ family response regulator
VAFDMNPASITPLARRIWVLIAAGCTQRQIARATALSIRTVEYEIQDLYALLKINPDLRFRKSGAATATRLAVKHGLIVFPKPLKVETYYRWPRRCLQRAA